MEWVDGRPSLKIQQPERESNHPSPSKGQFKVRGAIISSYCIFSTSCTFIAAHLQTFAVDVPV
jgi:hypothetical protein